jgi:outer membrane protein OmpA-like peptidoglycan-associated protein
MNCFIQSILGIFFIFSCVVPLRAQEMPVKDFNKSVQNADIVFYYDNDYEKAALLYESILKAFPGNCNIQAKLGICYLKIDGKKAEALKLLKSASSNVATEKKEYSETGEKSPVDTYLYLAEAYHLNDSLDKALSLFNDLKKKLGNTEEDVQRGDYIDLQIRDCRYALEMKKKPLTILWDLYAPWLGNYPGASNPVVSKSDSVFVFTQKTEGKTRILCSYKKGQWELPGDITKQLGGYNRLYTNSITGNGRTLILFMDDGGDGNLYYSERKDTTWTRIKTLGKPVNTVYWESHGFITPDGKRIYLSSNRPGGEGNLDIWISDKTAEGTWGEPVNCGNIINSPYDEDTPFFDPENNALLYSSVGHVSMGRYDLFRATINRYGSWNTPVGLPYAFNTAADNVFFILNNNAPGFITSLYDEKTKARNIYAIVAIDPADEITLTEGVVTLQDGMNIDPAQANMNLREIKKGTILQTIPLKENGAFKFEMKPGDYQLIVSHTGYKTDTTNLSLPLYFLSHYMVVNPSLIPEKVVTGEFLAIKNVLFGFDSYELDADAKAGLETLKTILNNHPELTIEVAGYTDAKGTIEYNRKLADKRAQAIIDYVAASGISANRFVKKAFGESNFAAVNTNRDGTDNPEGRKYNRRATFGIVDPQTGIVIRQDTYTPEHLRYASSVKYSIILKKTAEKLNPGYFSKLKLNGVLFIRTTETEKVNLYSLGVFYDRTDAGKYLEYVKGQGFTDAYVANQYELLNESKSEEGMANLPAVVSTGPKVYTIQLKAARSPEDMKVFRGIEGVREVLGDDGYYRYVTGEYTSFSKANEILKTFQEAGFKDAFIREAGTVTKK